MNVLKVLVGLVLSVMLTIGLISLAVGSAADSFGDQFKDQIEKARAGNGVPPMVTIFTNEKVRFASISIAVREKYTGVRPDTVSDRTVNGVRTVVIKFIYYVLVRI